MHLIWTRGGGIGVWLLAVCAFLVLGEAHTHSPADLAAALQPRGGARASGAGGGERGGMREAAFMSCCGSNMRRLLRYGSALAAVGPPRAPSTNRVLPGAAAGGGGLQGLGMATSTPSGDFRPRVKTPGQGADVYKAKQSLGQNFLVDQNVARRIVDSLECPSENGKAVVEVGPGKGALTAMLLNKYPDMTAVEIDERSVEYLNEQLPTLNVELKSVLDVDWGEMSRAAGGAQLSVIGNLPYYITSQILFSVVDAAPHVRKAVITMQLEVAQRVCATPGGRTYGILSVVTQLYGKPSLLFKIPPTVFQPAPDVDSALISVEFPEVKPEYGINMCHLRTVLRAAFQQRRKMLRQSLKALLKEKGVTLPDEVGTRRPETLAPLEFVELTRTLFGDGETPEGIDVWRGALGDKGRDA